MTSVSPHCLSLQLLATTILIFDPKNFTILDMLHKWENEVVDSP
jgi:hypothetical protein